MLGCNNKAPHLGLTLTGLDTKVFDILLLVPHIEYHPLHVSNKTVFHQQNC